MEFWYNSDVDASAIVSIMLVIKRWKEVCEKEWKKNCLVCFNQRIFSRNNLHRGLDSGGEWKM